MSTFKDTFITKIRKLFAEKNKPTQEDMATAFREARASAGGHAKAEKRKEVESEPEEVAAADAARRLSHEEISQKIQEALGQRVPGAFVVRTYDDTLIYMTGSMVEWSDRPPPIEFWQQGYSFDAETNGVTFEGERTQVERVEVFEEVAAQDAAGDDAESEADYSTTVTVRLGEADTLPEWVQIHRIGEWAVPNGSQGKIEMTRAIGDEIIRNFNARVLRRDVPLDEAHLTDQGGQALGWFTAVRWGSKGQGLPGAPEPDGHGPILYGRVRYTDIGMTKLGNEHYRYISPQYARNYRDRETGRSYGHVLMAVGALNAPFLRLRSIKGEEAPEPVLLADGITPDGITTEEEPTMPDSTPTTPPTDTTVSLAEHQRLADELAELRRERHREKVVTLRDAAIRDGMPPAVAKHIGYLMLQADPKGEAIVRLGEDGDDNAPATNLYDGLAKLFDIIPKLDLSMRTHQQDTRPGSGVATLDDQVVREASRYIRDVGGLPVRPSTNGSSNGTNGTHAESSGGVAEI